MNEKLLARVSQHSKAEERGGATAGKTKEVVSQIKAAWTAMTPAERDHLVVACIVGHDSWTPFPTVPVLKAVLALGGNPDACVASAGDFYPLRAKERALEICTWELEHREHKDLVLSKRQVEPRNKTLLAAAAALIGAGAKLGSYRNKRQNSPLHDAAEAGAHDLVRLLLRNGANPNVTNKQCETPLFSAARADDAASVKLLVAGGAKNIHNPKKDTASDAAFAHGAFQAHSTLRKAFGGPDMAGVFKNGPLSLEEAKRLLTRLRASSYTSVSVSGKEDPAGRRLIKRFTLQKATIVVTIDADKLPKLPHVVRSKLLLAIGHEAHRILGEAKIEVGFGSLGAKPRFSPNSGLQRVKEFIESYGSNEPQRRMQAPRKAARPSSPRRSANPLQPDHLVAKTEALLVYGWETKVDFDDIESRLDELTAALGSTRAVFVAATDLPNGGSCIPHVVIGWAAARAAASDGPVPVALTTIRKVEQNAELPPSVRSSLASLLLSPIKGKPRWRLVPTGPLAGADLVFGKLVDNPESEDEEVLSGCDMSQEPHKKGVLGERVGSSYRWRIRLADLSERADRARLARQPKGKYYVIAGYY